MKSGFLSKSGIVFVLTSSFLGFLLTALLIATKYGKRKVAVNNLNTVTYENELVIVKF